MCYIYVAKGCIQKLQKKGCSARLEPYTFCSIIIAVTFDSGVEHVKTLVLLDMRNDRGLVTALKLYLVGESTVMGEEAGG